MDVDIKPSCEYSVSFVDVMSGLPGDDHESKKPKLQANLLPVIAPALMEWQVLAMRTWELIWGPSSPLHSKAHIYCGIYSILLFLYTQSTSFQRFCPLQSICPNLNSISSLMFGATLFITLPIGPMFHSYPSFSVISGTYKQFHMWESHFQGNSIYYRHFVL